MYIQFNSLQFDEDVDDEQMVSTNSGRKRLFSKELRCMMFGFGDDKNPYTETVDLLEDLVIEYIAETTHRAMEIGRTGRVQVEDIIFLVRKDQRKYARVKDLLTMNEELKKARKAFDEIKYVGKYRISYGKCLKGFSNFLSCRKRGKTQMTQEEKAELPLVLSPITMYFKSVCAIVCICNISIKIVFNINVWIQYIVAIWFQISSVEY